MDKIKVYDDDGGSRICSIVKGQVVTKNQGKVLCPETDLFPDGYEGDMECYVIIPRKARKYDYKAISAMVSK